jgi:hypothetical protein
MDVNEFRSRRWPSDKGEYMHFVMYLFTDSLSFRSRGQALPFKTTLSSNWELPDAGAVVVSPLPDVVDALPRTPHTRASSLFHPRVTAWQSSTEEEYPDVVPTSDDREVYIRPCGEHGYINGTYAIHVVR